MSYVNPDDFRRRLYSANAPFAPPEDIVHKLGEQQAMPTPAQAAQSVQQVDIVWVQRGPQLALIPTVVQYAQQASTIRKQVQRWKMHVQYVLLGTGVWTTRLHA